MTDPDALPPPVPSLSDDDIFRDLPEARRAAVARQMVVSEYPAGHLFYAPDDEGSSIFLLRRGRVRVYKLSLEGRALTLLVLEPVAVFGEMALSERWRHDSFAEAMTDCQVAVIRRDALREILAEQPLVSMRLMGVMSSRLRVMERKLADIAFKSVPQRLATVLLGLAVGEDSGGAQAVVRYTHQQLAEMIGSYRETVTKTIGEFRAAGLIRVENDAIVLADMARLRAVVGS